MNLQSSAHIREAAHVASPTDLVRIVVQTWEKTIPAMLVEIPAIRSFLNEARSVD